MAKQRSRIYEVLLDGCAPVTLPKTWRFVDGHRDAYRLANPQRIFASLREQFSDDELLQSRVAVRRRGELVLQPRLVTRDRNLLTVRDSFSQPCSLITSAGDLHRRSPLFALGEDATIQESLQVSRSYLFVAASMEDVILLRSLGLPAAPSCGLNRLNKRALQHLLCVVDGFSYGPLKKKRLRTTGLQIDHSGYMGEDSERADFCVVLLGFELAAARDGVPDQILDAARHLSQAEQSLEISWGGGLSLWWPTEEELEDLNFRCKLPDAALVRDFFRGPKSLFDVADFADPTRLPNREKSFVDLLDELVDAEHNPRREGSQYFRERRRQRRDAHRQQIDERLFEPMIKAALENEDLRSRALGMQLAHLTRFFHRSMPRVYVEFAQSTAGVLPESAWKQIEAFVNQTIQLVKADAHLRKAEGNSGGWWPRS